MGHKLSGSLKYAASLAGGVLALCGILACILMAFSLLLPFLFRSSSGSAPVTLRDIVYFLLWGGIALAGAMVCLSLNRSARDGRKDGLWIFKGFWRPFSDMKTKDTIQHFKEQESTTESNN